MAQFFFDQSDGDANMTSAASWPGGGAYGLAGGAGLRLRQPGDNVSDRSMLSTTSGKGIVDNLIAEAEKNGN
ncbi:MAG: hypothetical protein ACLSVD_03120 [Eggerthellaceae bacterium]